MIWSSENARKWHWNCVVIATANVLFRPARRQMERSVPCRCHFTGWAGVFSLQFHYWGHWYTHKHTHGTLGMESYHLRWVQGDKNACIVPHRDCPSSSVALILFTVLMTEEATLLLSSICRSSPLIRDGTQNQTLLCHLIRGSWVCVCVCGNCREYISVN